MAYEIESDPVWNAHPNDRGLRFSIPAIHLHHYVMEGTQLKLFYTVYDRT